MKKIYGSLIHGKWIKGSNFLNVSNPFNNKTITEISTSNITQTVEAIKSCQLGFKSWSKYSAKDRSEILKNFFSLVKKHRTKIAEIITLESGKPIQESIVEVDYGASFIEWSAEQALRIKSDIFESPESGKKLFTIRNPIGVVAAITPWNFPLAMVTRKVSSAVAAGCADGTVRQYTCSGLFECLRIFEGHSGGILDCAVHQEYVAFNCRYCCGR